MADHKNKKIEVTNFFENDIDLQNFKTTKDFKNVKITVSNSEARTSRTNFQITPFINVDNDVANLVYADKDADFGVDDNTAEDWLLSTDLPILSIWGLNKSKMKEVTAALKEKKISRAWFYTYAYIERSYQTQMGAGWLNHWTISNIPDSSYLGSAKAEADWINDIITKKGQLAWTAPEGVLSIPQNVIDKGNAEYASDIKVNTIGNLYVQGTAAAVWELWYPEQSTASNIGFPFQTIVSLIKDMGGDLSKNKGDGNGSDNGGGNDGGGGNPPPKPCPPGTKPKNNIESISRLITPFADSQKIIWPIKANDGAWNYSQGPFNPYAIDGVGYDHNGSPSLDIGSGSGPVPLYAPFNGHYINSGYTENSPANFFVSDDVVTFADGKTGYALFYFLHDDNHSGDGTSYKQGQVIGHSGNHGFSTGFHTHMGIVYGNVGTWNFGGAYNDIAGTSGNGDVSPFTDNGVTNADQQNSFGRFMPFNAFHLTDEFNFNNIPDSGGNELSFMPLTNASQWKTTDQTGNEDNDGGNNGGGNTTPPPNDCEPDTKNLLTWLDTPIIYRR